MVERPAALTLVLAAWSSVAVAQPVEPESPADGAALFQSGLDDMLAGRYARGCPTLEASYRAEPLPGALFTLAECHAKAGRTATALSLYRDFVARVEAMAQPLKERQAERAAIAAQQLAALANQVARLTITLPGDAPVESVVRRDGAVVPAALLGRALPTDPGTHTLALELPDGSIARRTVVLDAGEREAIELPLPEELPEPGERTWHEPVAAAAAGLGFAGLVVGAVTGGLALDRAGDVDDHCSDGLCDAEGLQAAEAGEALGNTATVGLAVGGAAAAAALIVWLVAPDEESAARIDARGVGVAW